MQNSDYDNHYSAWMFEAETTEFAARKIKRHELTTMSKWAAPCSSLVVGSRVLLLPDSCSVTMTENSYLPLLSGITHFLLGSMETHAIVTSPLKTSILAQDQTTHLLDTSIESGSKDDILRAINASLSFPYEEQFLGRELTSLLKSLQRSSESYSI